MSKKMSAKQKFLKDRKDPKEIVYDYLVLAHCDNKPDVVVAIAHEDELLDVMNKVQEKYCKDNIGITGFINLGSGLSQEEIDNTLSHETGMNFDTGMYKIQVIPSHYSHYKMMKQNGLKHGEIVGARVNYA